MVKFAYFWKLFVGFVSNAAYYWLHCQIAAVITGFQNKNFMTLKLNSPYTVTIIKYGHFLSLLF